MVKPARAAHTSVGRTPGKAAGAAGVGTDVDTGVGTTGGGVGAAGSGVNTGASGFKAVPATGATD